MRPSADWSVRTYPQSLSVTVYVVDNNSPGQATRAVVSEFSREHPHIHYLLETRQGCSSARNAGILAGDGDLLGFIDDDEEIDADWFNVIAREFADPTVDYIGGPHLPNWVCPAPDWIPRAKIPAFAPTRPT